MPKLQHDVVSSPSDTTVPGLAQRRIWKSPEVLSHSLIVLTLPRLYLTPMTGTPKSEVISQLQTVRMVDTFLGPLATVIELHQIRRVKFELSTFTIVIDYYTANDPRARTMIQFANAEAADTFFAKLWRRLGDGYQLKSFAPEWWILARVPLVFVASLILFTFIAALGLNALADWGGDRDGPGQWLPNWRSLCIVSGGLVALVQVWLYRQSSQPPERLELLMK